MNSEFENFENSFLSKVLNLYSAAKEGGDVEPNLEYNLPNGKIILEEFREKVSEYIEGLERILSLTDPGTLLYQYASFEQDKIKDSFFQEKLGSNTEDDIDSLDEYAENETLNVKENFGNDCVELYNVIQDLKE
ncbi:hypothetical protein [Spirosoma oryzicola]|uniref:hypothetical protein n=1 Tax=Spirosoma oryzicola TaxID=2898794 RepID=UPI001E3FFD20|nr:hypothetical protein [Spirosoma oryzicola]UHG92950.1 hypothetical protein LQ777_08615 [Spirosoma oryzicola]